MAIVISGNGIDMGGNPVSFDKVSVYRQALLDSTTNWILPEELVL